MSPIRFLFTVLSALAVSCYAVPTVLKPREVSVRADQRFKFWSQYAAASYCESNYASKPGEQLACWAGNCPLVEASNTEVLADFSTKTVTDTTGFVALDDTHKNIIVSFRGSHSIRNWITDFVILPIPDYCPGCAVELGLWTAWEVVKDQVMGNVTEAAKQHPDYEIVVVGHSLGAAIATLSAVEIRSTGHNATLYAFASPRVGNKFMADYITAQGSNNRFAHAEDPVPHLPPSLLGFVHISPGYFINAPNNVTVTTKAIKVLQEDVNFEGNIGSLQHIQDHSWYFGHIDACSSSGTPFKIR